MVTAVGALTALVVTPTTPLITRPTTVCSGTWATAGALLGKWATAPARPLVNGNVPVTLPPPTTEPLGAKVSEAIAGGAAGGAGADPPPLARATEGTASTSTAGSRNRK